MVCFYIGERMAQFWIPGPSLATYISFDPGTGFLTFKPPKVIIDLTASLQPALPEHNYKFAISQLFPSEFVQRMNQNTANMWKEFLERFDDFFSRFGPTLQQKLRDDLEESMADEKIRLILELLLRHFQDPSHQHAYAILRYVAANVYKDDKRKAELLEAILVDLMHQYTTAKRAAGPSPSPSAVAQSMWKKKL